MLRALIAPGFFSSSAVTLALGVGAAVAVVGAAVGVFTVIRGQSFATHALGDIGAAGGASAYLAGASALWGFTVVAVAGAAVMELIGIQRLRGRDLATGVVLGVGFGLSALFLYLGSTYDNTTGAAVTILFGSIFALQGSVLPFVLGLGGGAIAILATLFRPLLLASTSPDLAAAKGLPVRLLGVGYLLAMAIAVALAALTVGSILSTALLIGPAAAALKLTARPLPAIATAAGIGIAAVWLGVLLAYDSYRWPPVHQGWPASFFIVTLVLLTYLAAGGVSRRRARRPRPAGPGPASPVDVAAERS
ncbi:metal ABC transporter permease [Conexibacter sp. DBS9H8]|uniref:metal ABC transporter permease n=1 Tax=Conexibacter sp. DBS9H8 TaxID=2937801 RepID=UPI00200EE2FD|nr:metal ABC transporter permease [Conexibacter sp. DBS9H8]